MLAVGTSTLRLVHTSNISKSLSSVTSSRRKPFGHPKTNHYGNVNGTRYARPRVHTHHRPTAETAVADGAQRPGKTVKKQYASTTPPRLRQRQCGFSLRTPRSIRRRHNGNKAPTTTDRGPPEVCSIWTRQNHRPPTTTNTTRGLRTAGRRSVVSLTQGRRQRAGGSQRTIGVRIVGSARGQKPGGYSSDEIPRTVPLEPFLLPPTGGG